MKLKIETCYTISGEKIQFDELDVFNDLKTYLESCFEDYDEVNLEDIEGVINDYISFDLDFKIRDDYFDGIEYTNILNMEEILEQFKYLIKENKKDCYSNQTGNYCSTCGKPLK